MRLKLKYINLQSSTKKISVHGHLSLNSIHSHAAMLPLLFKTVEQKSEIHLSNTLSKTNSIIPFQERDMTTLSVKKGKLSDWFYNKPKIESELKHHAAIERQTCTNDSLCPKKLCNGADKLICQKNPNTPFISELVGNMTHTPVPGKNAEMISETDYNGQNKPQHIIFEKKGVILTGNTKELKEIPKASKMVQQDCIAQMIRNKVSNSTIYE